jgi:LysR family transcriptional regulator, transcriptional activator for dmlA
VHNILGFKTSQHGLDCGGAALSIEATIKQVIHSTKATMAIDRIDLDLLLAIHHEGSLAAAAQRLDIAAPAASKRLATLEARLKTRLVHRTTRRLQLTGEGETFVAHAQPLAEGFAQLEQALAERSREPRGRLRVLSSPGFGRVQLAPVLAAFQQAHAGLTIELHLAERLPDLTDGRFDMAVWLFTPPEGNLIVRRLAPNRRVVVASPAYLARRGLPLRPEELAKHDCLVVHEHRDRPALWQLQPVNAKASMREALTVRVSGPLLCNHGEVVREWALAGHGLMLRSLWDVHALLATGQLVHVLPAWAVLDADVQLLLPPRPTRLAAPRRVQLLQEHLVKSFMKVPWSPGATRAPPKPRPPP